MERRLTVNEIVNRLCFSVHHGGEGEETLLKILSAAIISHDTTSDEEFNQHQEVLSRGLATVKKLLKMQMADGGIYGATIYNELISPLESVGFNENMEAKLILYNSNQKAESVAELMAEDLRALLEKATGERISKVIIGETCAEPIDEEFNS